LISGVDVFSLTQYHIAEIRQVWKEAAAGIIDMCRELLILSWLLMIMDDRESNLRCTEIHLI
tara:strand:+ start:2030 stop:2215 length:186 start_codon:yes stop_codon:yes gene_type:complete